MYIWVEFLLGMEGGAGSRNLAVSFLSIAKWLLKKTGFSSQILQSFHRYLLKPYYVVGVRSPVRYIMTNKFISCSRTLYVSFLPHTSKRYSYKVQFFPDHLGWKVKPMESLLSDLQVVKTYDGVLASWCLPKEKGGSKLSPVLSPDRNRPFFPAPVPQTPRPAREPLEEVVGTQGPSYSHWDREEGSAHPTQSYSEEEAALREMKRSLPIPFTARERQPKPGPWRRNTYEANATV